MGFLEMIEDVGHGVGERVDDLGKFYSAALCGSTGAEAVPAPELAQKVLGGPGTSGWHDGASQAAQLSSQHHDAGDLVSRMSTGLESAWTGRAADAARTRIRALAEIASVSAAIYTTNSANLSDVAHGFDAMKTSLQPMPDKPPQLTFLDRISPWDTDAEKEINHYNAMAQQNVDRYQAYVQHARTGSRQLQTDYGRLDDFGGRSNTAGSRMKARRRPDEAPHFPEPRNSGHPPTAAPPVSGAAVPQGPSAKPGPGRAPGPDERTTVSGWSPDPATATGSPSGAPYTGGSGSGSSTGTPGIPAQGTVGHDGGRGAGKRAERENKLPGEPRSRTSAPSPRPGTGTGKGAGAGTGAGKGTGEEPRPTTTPTRGTPGSRGAPGVSGPTPNRRKDEDPQDHHRKYGLESDSAFSLTDDDGDRAVDPRTGLPPTPPTIGG
ncbi:hypothetical protein L3Q65_40635 [Amycolatopsis sp. FU40]|uniref:hypothetical protein n=1 Tax=Amycolatopsis sp. FU40 TaxID=2914159 RepID=UPI001F32BB95|nr:hypothetical protein [Amycolatopsis sp. FU40]UKD54123.1 hypothetical protein L3Q65_40635 [Amycolatopsis sp. FU40]